MPLPFYSFEIKKLRKSKKNISSSKYRDNSCLEDNEDTSKRSLSGL